MFVLVKKSNNSNYISNFSLIVLFIVTKNQECSVKNVTVDNDYMAYSYKIRVDKCIGSCNDKDNPYFKICLPDSIKNISVKSFDLLSKKNVLKDISFN